MIKPAFSCRTLRLYFQPGMAVLLLCSLLLSACGSPPAARPSSTPLAAAPTETNAPPSTTPLPSATPTVTPTLPPTPTETPAASATPAEPLKIAIIAPLSGGVQAIGESMRDGALLAIEEWNAQGGILGRQIVAVIEDGQCDPDAARAAAERVIDQEGVHYILGELCSSASIPLSEVAHAHGVIQITSTSTNPLVTVAEDGTLKPYSFRSCMVDPYQGVVMANFAHQQGYQKAFILSQADNIYSSEIAQTFEQAFTAAGGAVVGQAAYPDAQSDFAPLLKQAADGQADVLFVPGYSAPVNLIGAQAKELGLQAVLLGSDGWDTPELDLAALDGSFYTNHYDPGDTRAGVVAWQKRYGAAYADEQGRPKIPDAVATLSYDAANLLLSAIQLAGVDDAALVKDVLSGGSFDTTLGSLRFDPQNNPLKCAPVVAIKDGQKTYFDTVCPADG